MLIYYFSDIETTLFIHLNYRFFAAQSRLLMVAQLGRFFHYSINLKKDLLRKERTGKRKKETAQKSSADLTALRFELIVQK